MSKEQKVLAEGLPAEATTEWLISEMENRYNGDDADAYSDVLGTAIATLEERQNRLIDLMARREIEGEPTSHLEMDLKIVKAQTEAFTRALTIYTDLKKLNRADRAS